MYDDNFEEDFEDIRNKLPNILRDKCILENEDGEDDVTIVEFSPKNLEIVNTHVYSEKSENSMGEEYEHTLEGEVEFEGNTYLVTMTVWEYPIGAVANYEIEDIKLQ